MPEIRVATDLAPLRTLPIAVRSVILHWAAETVGSMPAAQIPPVLVRVARFTPSKRARLGALVLRQALESDAAFRAAVAERATSDGPATEKGRPETEPAAAAAAAYLLGLPGADQLLAAAREAESKAPSEEIDRLQAELRQLHRLLKRVTAERDEALSRLQPGPETEETDKLRRRLREQGTRLRSAELAAQAEGTLAERELELLRGQVSRLGSEVTTWQERSRLAVERGDRAQEALGRLREQTSLHKATADRRLDLLLSTVEGAVSGLRREWDLAGGGSDPADVVADRLTGPGQAPESTADPARLNAWLTLPSAHLIVDGYNVTKAGFPDLTLAQQRERLVRLLSALSARTSAEVTVVFDGAAIAVPAPAGRGIRVLFSPPGVIADDVLRALAAAEPVGRVVIVVSSDREVADGVRRSGARTAGSEVLLAALR